MDDGSATNWIDQLGSIDPSELLSRSAGHPALEFLGPGLLHGINNHLMVLKGARHPRAARKVPREAVEHAARRAEAIVAVLQAFSNEEASSRPIGSQLEPVMDAARHAFRDSGLGFEWEVDAAVKDLMGPERSTVVRVGSTLLGLHVLLDGGPKGSVRVQVRAESRAPKSRGARVVCRFGFESAPMTLPFPLDWRIAADVADEACDGELRLRIDQGLQLELQVDSGV